MITANVPAIFPIFPPVSELFRVRLPDLSILEVYELTKDAAKAERVIIAYRWPYGPRCPEQGCGSLHIRQCRGYKRANELPIRFVCIACGRRFTVRTGYFLSGSSLPFTVWLWALYLVLSTTGMRYHNSRRPGSANTDFSFPGKRASYDSANSGSHLKRLDERSNDHDSKTTTSPRPPYVCQHRRPRRSRPPGAS